MLRPIVTVSAGIAFHAFPIAFAQAPAGASLAGGPGRPGAGGAPASAAIFP